MTNQRLINYFDRPVPSLRHSMPFVAELFTGADEVSVPIPGLDVTVEVFHRGTVRLTGELAAYDGVSVPLGLRGAGEEWDVVMAAVKGDGITGVGVCRRGSRPVDAVIGGSLSVESGTVGITTVEQVKADGPLSYPDGSPWVLHGSVSDSVRIGNNTGDGDETIIALLDDSAEMCGVFVGSVFESGMWSERVLPGEPVMSVAELKEAAEDVSSLDRMTPVAVYDASENLLGYVTDYYWVNNFGLILTSAARPDDVPATVEV